MVYDFQIAPEPGPSFAQETVEADDTTAATATTQTDDATQYLSANSGVAAVGKNIEYSFLLKHVAEHPICFLEVRC